MKNTWMAIAVATTLTLVGCSEKEVSNNEGTLEEVVVQIQTAEKLAVGEEIILSAKVTQGDKAIENADQVQFEVWESGMRDHGEKIEGKHTKDGVYESTYSFDHDGIYYMFAHTTANGLHVMPKQELIVGNPDMSKVVPDESGATMDHGEHK